MSYAYLATSIVLVVASNLIVKVSSASQARADLPTFFFRLALDPNMWVAVAAFVIGTATWLLALRKLDLSIAQPLMASVFVLGPVAAFLFLGEVLPAGRVAGLSVIALGIVIVALSG